MARIIGLTGYRGTGKSEIARHLCERHGFASVHAFAGGKAASEAYFRHLGASEVMAWEMVHGALRDVPSKLLPIMAQHDSPGRRDHATPRYFMEMFGNFMGATLGTDWTAGAEIRRHLRDMPGRDIVLESVVYEDQVVRDFGGVIIRIDRAGALGRGLKTDEAVTRITPDAVFLNEAGTVAEMLSQFDLRFLEQDPDHGLELA